MVRNLAFFLAACALASCGSARYMSGGPGAPPPFETGSYVVVEEVDDASPMELEFEGVERLKENPIDPAGASIETLLSIPGFPEELAGRIVAESGERRSAKRWIERLTPPERSELYRYRDYLLLPEEQPVRLICRLTKDGISAQSGGREEGYLSCSAGSWKALWRSRRLAEGNGFAYYLSGSALSGAVRFHGGTFVPDFALGLMFGDSYQSYVYSSSYPFHDPRWIAGSTSFYAPTVYGAAAEFWRRSVRGAFIAGRPRRYRSDHFELDGELLCGGRLALRLRGGEFALSSFGGAFAAGAAAHSIDGRWRSGALALGFELASRGRGEPGVISALSYRVAGTRCALSLHAIPSGMAGRYCAVSGGTFDGKSSHGGAAIVVEREIVSRVRVRAAIDRSVRTDGLEGRARHTTRAECEKKWRKAFVRLSWSRSKDAREDIIPYPGAGSQKLDRTTSIGLLSEFRIAGGTNLRITLRGLNKNASTGFLIVPVLSMSLLSGHLRPAASLALYRALRGKPACCFYEPSLKGTSPWRVASADKGRCAFIMSYIINRLNISYKAVLEVKKVPEFSLQAVFDY
jgi:hypothetical protein